MSLVTVSRVARMIDHSLLQPTLCDQDLEEGLRLAVRHGVASVCIKPYYVPRAAEVLKGSSVAVGTVVGFPHGGHTSGLKARETEEALRAGAREVDVVMNIGKALSGDWDYVERELAGVLRLCREGGAISKVIFENCYLKAEQKIRLCHISESLGADYVKTSTGYGTGGAVDDDLRLMRANVSKKVGVKAAGGVRTFARLAEVMRLGVTRVGATATEAILAEASSVLGEGLEEDELYRRMAGPVGGGSEGY